MREDPDPPAQPLTNITTVTSKTSNILLWLTCLCLGNQVDMNKRHPILQVPQFNSMITLKSFVSLFIYLLEVININF